MKSTPPFNRVFYDWYIYLSNCMNNTLNFKIDGSGPTGLLLAITLSKLNFNIYLTDLLTREKLISKDKTYAITHSTRKILSKYNPLSEHKFIKSFKHILG